MTPAEKFSALNANRFESSSRDRSMRPDLQF
jgi:hypothetical protein